MTRHFIKDSRGNNVKNNKGERLFTSDRDGDSRPGTKQTVYREHKWGGNSKVKSTYNPSKGEFNK